MAAITALRAAEKSTPTSPRSVAEIVSIASLAMLAVIVGRWAWGMWTLGFDAKPVLAMFEAAAGRPLTGDEWFAHEQARAVFCPHPDADPATSPIGRFIDGSAMYGPLIAMQMIGITLANGVLALIGLNLSSQRRRRGFAVTIMAIFVAAVVPLVVHYDTISILTNVTE